MLYIHACINIIAEGRSTVRIFALIAFFIVLYLLHILSKKKWFLSQRAKNVTDAVFSKRNLLFGFIILFFIGFAGFVFLSQSHHIALNDFLVTFNNSELSTSRFVHNHVLKGIVALTLNSFGQSGVYENMDAGTAHIGLLPHLYFGISLFLFLLIGLSVFVYFYRTTNRYQGVKALGYGIAYGLLTFSLLKTVIDGGLFHEKTLIALGFLLILLYTNRLTQVYRRTLYLLGGYCVYFALLWWGGFVSTWAELLSHFYAGILFGLLIICALYLFYVGRFTRTFVLLFIFFIIAAIPSIKKDTAIAEYRNISLAQGGYVALYQTVPDYIPLTTIGGLHLYQIPANQTKTVGDVLNTNNLLDNLYPISVPWETCFPSGRPIHYTFNIVAHTPMFRDVVNDKNIVVHTFKKISDKPFPTYFIDLELPACYPRQLNVIEELLKSTGADDFIMYNLKII